MAYPVYLLNADARMPHLYFEASAAVITLVLLGNGWKHRPSTFNYQTLWMRQAHFAQRWLAS